MSRLITTISIILSIILLSLGGICYIKQTKSEAIALTDEAIELCRQKNQAELEIKIKKLVALWESKQLVLSLYVRHDEMERIDNLLVIITAYTENESFESACVELHQLQFMLDHIYQRELPNLNNLL